MTDLLANSAPATVAQSNGQPRRIRGLRLAAVPSWPLVAQVAGASAAVVGVGHEWGWGIAAIVGGVASVVAGMLREGGKI